MTMIVCENSFFAIYGNPGVAVEFSIYYFRYFRAVLESRTEKSGFWGFFQGENRISKFWEFWIYKKQEF